MQKHYTVPPPDLCGLPLAASRYGLPERHDEARGRFRDAKADYEAGEFAKAAEAFMKAAELLAPPKPETTYSESFAKMRAASYRNASMAFVAARDEAGRTRAFTAAKQKDPVNAALLDELLTP